MPGMGTEPGETYIAGISPPAPEKQVKAQVPGYVTSDSQHSPGPESSHVSFSLGDVCAISTKDTIPMYQRDPIPAKQQSIHRHSRNRQT